MKLPKHTIRALAVALCSVLGGAASQVNAGTIVGTAHDFSASGFSGGEICVVCHTPHSSNTTVTEAPLWDHDLTAQTFAMYDSPTFDATQDLQPTGAAKLCLSCHDGTTAVDSFGGNVGTTVISGPAAIGGSDTLADDHPISVLYDTALSVTDPGMHDPSTATVTIGTGGTKVRGPDTVANLLLPADKVECSSCHDVHNNFVVPGAVGTPFLKVSKAGSAICLTCHDK